jgi:hypothetical protein
MKITLAKIKERHPCPNGWEKIRAAQGPDIDREWPLVEAFDSNDLDDVLWALRCLPEYNALWRKYSVWCVKQVEHLLTDQRSKDALEVAWRHSEGQASDAELAAASDAAKAEAKDAAIAAAYAAALASASDAAWAAAGASASDAAWAAALASASLAAWAAAEAARYAASDARYAAGASARASARAAQKNKLIQILSAGEWVEENEK